MEYSLRHWINKAIVLFIISYYGLYQSYNIIYKSDRVTTLFAVRTGKSTLHIKQRLPGSSFNTHSGYRYGKLLSSAEKPMKKLNGTLPLCPLRPPGLMGRVKLILEAKGTLQQLQDAFSNSSLMAGGWYQPAICEARNTVAIVVPYRNRFAHLNIFIRNIHSFLQRQQLDYTIFVIEQEGGEKFNRGMLFNVGFVEAMKCRPFDCFIFHDVDLLPEDDRNLYTCPKQPRHMSSAVDILDYKLPYRDLFGGVGAISSEQFQLINGFSNTFWGWGGEDDDFSYRIKAHGLNITRYPQAIARYTMLEHEKQKANPQSSRASVMNLVVSCSNPSLWPVFVQILLVRWWTVVGHLSTNK